MSTPPVVQNTIIQYDNLETSEAKSPNGPDGDAHAYVRAPSRAQAATAKINCLALAKECIDPVRAHVVVVAIGVAADHDHASEVREVVSALRHTGRMAQRRKIGTIRYKVTRRVTVRSTVQRSVATRTAAATTGTSSSNSVSAAHGTDVSDELQSD